MRKFPLKDKFHNQLVNILDTAAQTYDLHAELENILDLIDKILIDKSHEMANLPRGKYK